MALFRDPLDDDTADVLPWECTSRDGVYGGASRRRQDSAADSGSSSSDVSSAVAVAERTRRLPQQSTLDGGLRGAPPPLRRLSAVEPRHLAPLGSPPHSPRPPRPAPTAPPAPAGPPAPPHPTPTISVSSAPDDESADSPAGTGSPEERRSVAASDEPSSVFASADATPTEPTVANFKALDDRCALAIVKTISSSFSSGDARTDVSNVDIKVVEEPSTEAQSSESYDESAASGGNTRVSEWTKWPEDDVVSVQRSLSREPSTTKEISPASCKDISGRIGELPESESYNVEADNGSEIDCPVHGIKKLVGGEVNPSEVESFSTSTPEPTEQSARSAVSESSSGACRTAAVSSVSAAAESVRAPVAPLAVSEDIVDEETADKAPSESSQRPAGECKAASESDAIKKIAHKDELSSVSESNIVKRENMGGIGERKQRNDICPWEDE